MAEVLEHADFGAQLKIPRARTTQILAARDHGRSHLLRAEGRTIPIAGSPKIRYSVPDIRPVRQPSPQHAGPQRGRRRRYVQPLFYFKARITGESPLWSTPLDTSLVTLLTIILIRKFLASRQSFF